MPVKQQKFSLKHDTYRAARGGYARFLNVYCGHCQTHVLLYQKDGPGTLFRLYLDRIFAPESLANLQEITDISKVPDLRCPSCKVVIGTPYIWEEEFRKAYLLKQGSFIKKISTGTYPPPSGFILKP